MLNTSYHDPMYAFEIEDEKPAYALLEILHKERVGLENIKHDNEGSPDLAKMSYWRSQLHNSRLTIQQVYERELPQITDSEERRCLIDTLSTLEILLQSKRDFVSIYTHIA